MDTKIENHIDDEQWGRDILVCLPNLRAFARLLTRDRIVAEDLVQDTIVRALTYKAQFQPGTNLQSWMMTILRNRWFNEVRRKSNRSEVQMDLEIVAGSRSGGQEEAIEIRDFHRAFAKLPPAHREALILVGATGLSYEEAAEITGCAIGTMKSRVCRARQQLQDLLNKPAPSVARSSGYFSRAAERSSFEPVAFY